MRRDWTCCRIALCRLCHDKADKVELVFVILELLGSGYLFWHNGHIDLQWSFSVLYCSELLLGGTHGTQGAHGTFLELCPGPACLSAQLRTIFDPLFLSFLHWQAQFPPVGALQPILQPGGSCCTPA